jgi:hypothetical protein
MSDGSAAASRDAFARSRRLLVSVALAALLLAALFAGCTLPRGGTQQQECSVDSQCDDGNPCTIDTCTAQGMCDWPPVTDNEPLANQTPGDCTLRICNQGVEVPQYDPSDLPDDGNDCTDDSCSESDGPVHDTAAADGSSCTEGTQAGRCANGTCVTVECQTDDQCDPDTSCRDFYCGADDTCQFTDVPDGTPLPPAEQTEGDCAESLCFGGEPTDYPQWSDLPIHCNAGCQIPICDELEVNGRCQNEPRGFDCSAAGGNVCNDDGLCVDCNEAIDCGQPPVPSCETRTCVSETCIYTYASAGTPLPSSLQQPGDCHELQCDGSGGEVDAIDDSDPYDDSNDCTDDLCTNGSPHNDDLPLNTPCGLNDALYCDSGRCVGCTDAGQCEPDPTYPECMQWTCPGATQECTPSYTSAGTPLTTGQTAGDCREIRCDGTGGITNAVLNSDLPIDGNDCTDDQCNSGTPDNPPFSGGTVCSGGVCNGSGSCEDCYSEAQCPLPSQVCLEDYCRTTDWTCQERPVPANQAALLGHQIPGDCRTIRCDGSGNEITPYEENNSDPFIDGNDCTDDLCNSGTPENPPRADGVSCTGGASGQCWDGFCCDVQCNDTCEACANALTGQPDGQCAAIPFGTDPEGECPANELCRAPGDCDEVDGQPCSGNNECLNDHCVDGYCCDTVCTDTCYSCQVAGDEGTCSLVPSGQDPDSDCASGSVCDGSGTCLVDTGEACTNPSSCLSNLCVDGYCCDTDCSATCYSCALAGTQGTCTIVPPDQDPDSDCANNERCDGSGTCLLLDGETCSSGGQCLSDQCVDSVCCDSACGGVCEGCTNALTGQTTGQCAPVTPGTDPQTECNTNERCNGVADCDYVDGETCTDGTDCLSGYCVNGYCCNSDCTTNCYSCQVSGSEGTCTVVGSGDDPDPDCANNERCDGSGSCLKNDGQTCSAGSECLSGHCANGYCCNSDCTTNCYSCAISGSEGTCTLVGQGDDPDPDCAGNERCDGSGNCLLVDGQTCNGNSECLSDICVNGYCCNSTCALNCYSCQLSGSEGTCTIVPSGNDPDPDCSSGQLCDGSGGCKRADGQGCNNDGQCLSDSCVDGVCCNSDCNAECYSCQVAGSVGTCTVVGQGDDPDPDCLSNERCDGSGSCLLVDGQSCTNDGQCVSGSCADGYCCNSSCTAECYSCGLTGTEGTCTVVPSGFDPDPDCGPGEQCNGLGACLKNDGGGCTLPSECLSGNCVDNFCCGTTCTAECYSCGLTGTEGTCTVVPPNEDPDPDCNTGELCDGGGNCLKQDGETCGGPGECLSNLCVDGYCCNSDCTTTCYSCQVAGSEGTCTAVPTGEDPDSDCNSGEACDASGTCLLVDGETCGGPGECLSNACADGVCCDSDCVGECRACIGSVSGGNDGECTFIPGTPAPNDPEDECTDGACNGAGACVLDDGQSCSDGAECLSGNCPTDDGVCCNEACGGLCRSCIDTENGGTTGTCGNVSLNLDPDDDCTDPDVCDGNGGCGRAQGAGCTNNNQCASGFCVDDVCCDTSCNGDCEACTNAITGGTEGECNPVPDGTSDPACAPDACAAGGVCCGDDDTPPGGTCPGICDNGCAGNVCVINADSNNQFENGSVTCPAGFACHLVCSADDSCRNTTITCPADAYACDVDCTCTGGDESCCRDADITCGAGTCDLSCSDGTDACDGTTFNCTSNECSTTCATTWSTLTINSGTACNSTNSGC